MTRYFSVDLAADPVTNYVFAGALYHGHDKYKKFYEMSFSSKSNKSNRIRSKERVLSWIDFRVLGTMKVAFMLRKVKTMLKKNTGEDNLKLSFAAGGIASRNWFPDRKP